MASAKKTPKVELVKLVVVANPKNTQTLGMKPVLTPPKATKTKGK